MAPANQSKAAKAAPAKAATNAKAKKGGSSGGPTGRRSPEEVKKIIYIHLCEMYEGGVTEVSKQDLSLVAGYKNPRSEGFTKPVAVLIKEDGLVEKGGSKDTFRLTQTGIDSMPKVAAPKDNMEAHERFLTMLEKHIKASPEKLRQLWAILVDGQPHSIESLSERLGYGNTRSFGNTKMVSAIKKMGLADNPSKGVVQLTDKAFPIKKPQM